MLLSTNGRLNHERGKKKEKIQKKKERLQRIADEECKEGNSLSNIVEVKTFANGMTIALMRDGSFKKIN